MDYCEDYGHDLLTGATHERKEYAALQPDGRAIRKHADYVEPAEAPDDEYPLMFTTGRTAYHFHTRTKTGRAPELNSAATRGEAGRFAGRTSTRADDHRLRARHRRWGGVVKLRKGIEDVHEAEAHLARELYRVCERHAADPDVLHMSHALAHRCAEHQALRRKGSAAIAHTARDGELIEVVQICQQEAQHRWRWVRTKIKESSQQLLATG